MDEKSRIKKILGIVPALSSVVLLALVLLFGTANPVLALEQEQQLLKRTYPDLLQDDFLDDDDVFDDEELENVVNDPLEPMNRLLFEVNDVLYDYAFKPVTDAYVWVIPFELRVSFGNFFKNMGAPVRLLNSVLQGDLEKSGVVLQRFMINSTLGVYGLVDAASNEFAIQPKRADFGQTLGVWGVGTGVYIYWPVLGPSNLRDTVGLVVDVMTSPLSYFHDSTVFDMAYWSSKQVNSLSLNINVYEDLRKYSLDPYVASRQAYLEYRNALVEKDK